MSRSTCANCNGQGKVIANIKFNMNYPDIQRQILYGEKSYRDCDVCAGTGSVSLERAYYSHDGEVSLNNARQLFQKMGKPIEVHVAQQVDEVWVKFGDGSRYVLGAFGVGYVGTRPDNFKHLLDTAGFNISMEEIVAMEAPLSLRPGYRPPGKVAGTGTTLEEARKNAYASLPPGAEILSENIVDDGSAKTVEGTGASLEEARQDAKSRLPSEAVVEEEKIISSESKAGMVSVYARNFIQADRKAQKRVPAGARLDHISTTIYLGTRNYLIFGRINYRWNIPARVQIKYHRPITIGIKFVCRE